MAPLPLPKFSTWKSLINRPSNRSSIGGQQKFNWDILFKPFGDILNFAFSGVLQPFLSWSMTGLVQIISSSTIFIFNFNWNSTDEDLLLRLAAARLIWFEQFGETIGLSIGWVTCGILPSAVVVAINKPMGLYILEEVGQEAYEEMVAELAVLLSIAGRNYANAALTNLFISLRWTVKNAANRESDTLLDNIAPDIIANFPGLDQAIEKWGQKGGKPWIISNAIEEVIENAPIGEEWKAFLEGLIEGLGEGCLEAGFTFANAFDNYIANQALVTNGSPNTVVVTPNRLAPNEKIIVHGNVEQLKQSITNALANYQLIYNRDIGYNLGMPLIERAAKQISEYVIVLFVKSAQKPPYPADIHEHYCTLNSANPLRFSDYDRVIRALGGGGEGQNFGYMFGRFLGIAQMSDGGTIKVWCDSVQNAKDRIDALAELSIATIQTMNVTEELKEYERDKTEALAKGTYRVYPYKMEILRKTKVLNDYDRSTNALGNVKATKQGYYLHSPTYRLDLWQSKKPSNWDDVIRLITAPIPQTP